MQVRIADEIVGRLNTDRGSLTCGRGCAIIVVVFHPHRRFSSDKAAGERTGNAPEDLHDGLLAH